MVSILLALLILAVILWLVSAFLPLPYPIKNIVLVVILIIGLLWAFGYGGIHLR